MGNIYSCIFLFQWCLQSTNRAFFFALLFDGFIEESQSGFLGRCFPHLVTYPRHKKPIKNSTVTIDLVMEKLRFFPRLKNAEGEIISSPTVYFSQLYIGIITDTLTPPMFERFLHHYAGQISVIILNNLSNFQMH